MSYGQQEAGFEDRIRHRAYALWESEGRPFGRDAEHWRLSEELTRAELVAAPKPKKAAARKAPAPKSAAPKRIAQGASAVAHH